MRSLAARRPVAADRPLDELADRVGADDPARQQAGEDRGAVAPGQHHPQRAGAERQRQPRESQRRPVVLGQTRQLVGDSPLAYAAIAAVRDPRRDERADQRPGRGTEHLDGVGGAEARRAPRAPRARQSIHDAPTTPPAPNTSPMRKSDSLRDRGATRCRAVA